MRRRLHTFCVFLALGAATACGGSPSSNPPTRQAPTSSPTPAPSPTQTQANVALFAGNNGNGVAEFNAADGTPVETFATSLPVEAVGLDDAANVYTVGFTTSNATKTLAEFSKFAIGGNAALATFTPSHSVSSY
jgi:hypothetical protein